jgi:hypothetical protein
MPGVTSAYEYTLDAYALKNLLPDDGSEPTRDDVEEWLTKNSGDFQSIDDFCASISIGKRNYEFPWANEESELTYNDCMFPNED